MTVDFEQVELEYLIGLITQDFCNKQRDTGKPTPFESGVMRKIYDVRAKMMEEKFGRPKHESGRLKTKGATAMETRSMENRFIDGENNPAEFLIDAMTPIVNEMFSIAGEKGFNQLWCDEGHPLTQAVRILHKAQVQVKYGFYSEDEGKATGMAAAIALGLITVDRAKELKAMLDLNLT